MKRTLKSTQPFTRKKLRYKKITGGLSFLADGTKVIKDQIFESYPEDIPQAFKGKFLCLSELTPTPEPGIKIKLQPAGKNKWDIVNELTGETLNEKPLSPAEAKGFLEDKEDLPKEEKEVKPVKGKSVKKEEVPDLDDEDEDEEFDD